MFSNTPTRLKDNHPTNTMSYYSNSTTKTSTRIKTILHLHIPRSSLQPQNISNAAASPMAGYTRPFLAESTTAVGSCGPPLKPILSRFSSASGSLMRSCLMQCCASSDRLALLIEPKVSTSRTSSYIPKFAASSFRFCFITLGQSTALCPCPLHTWQKPLNVLPC